MTCNLFGWWGEKFLSLKWQAGTEKKLIYSSMYKLTPEGVTSDNWFVEENRKDTKDEYS